MDYYEFVRYANATMAILVTVLAVAKARLLWNWLPHPGKLMYSAYVAVMTSIAYGTIDAIRLNIEPSFRVSFVGGALLLGVIAFAWPDCDLKWMTFWHKLKKR